MQLLVGDCIATMRTMPDCSIDAIVTDPPYGLEFMGKGWDSFKPAEFQAFCESWACEALRVLKPGGHLLAFGGTRTYHRMTCGIEDAGFEIRDSIDWLYGSGFPKSRNVGEGRGTALKPAHEPIVVARKPLIGTVAANVVAFGTGALNIDACRIETDDDLNGGAYAKVGNRTESSSLHTGSGMNQPGKTAGREYEQPAGRWPANVVLDEVAATMLDEQSGILTSGDATNLNRNTAKFRNAYGAFDGKQTEHSRGPNSGGASRFFYCAKTSRRERNAGDAQNDHPTVKPIALMRWLVRLVTPPDGTVLDPFMGSGSTGCAAVLEGFDFVGIDLDPHYVEISRSRISHWRDQRDPQVALFA